MLVFPGQIFQPLHFKIVSAVTGLNRMRLVQVLKACITMFLFFFSVRERAEFNKSAICLIWSMERPEFSHPACSWRAESTFGLGRYPRPRAEFFPIRTSRLVNKLYLLSVWENLDLGRQYRPNGVRSVPATGGSPLQTDLARLIRCLLYDQTRKQLETA